MKVIVTDVRYRMSLPVIRSLGQAGARIICADRITTKDSAALGFYSRYTHARAHLPNPADTEDFLTALISLSGDDRPVLMPVGIDTLLTLCKNRDVADAHFDVALPPYDSILLANDKLRLMQHAKKQDVPCPATATLREGESIEALSARVKYPAVIKYRAGELLGLDPKERYCIVKNCEELIEKYTYMNDLQANPLVQEYVEGEGFGVSVVMDKAHNPIKVFCHRRIHEYPVSGGPSCLCESAWDDSLANYAVTLLRSLDWEGVAMVEFKGNPEKGYRLMEINPRFWGSFALAPASGCDIAGALAYAAQGKLSERDYPECDYKVGQRLRFALQDALAFPGYLKKADKKPGFAIKYLLGLLDPRIRDGVFSAKDPYPWIKYLIQAFKKTDKIIR